MDKTLKFNIKLESNGKEVFHKLTVNADDFRSAVNKSVEETRRLSTTMQNLAATGMAFDALQDAIDALQGSIDSLAESYNVFDRGMRKVNTMAGVGREELDGLKTEIEELGATIPMAKDALADGLYQVISNGVPRDNWISFLERSAKASVGGIADLGQTVTVTSTIIKNYGLAWDAAGEIQDKIQMTAKNGVTSFEQLAAALPRVTGSAATLGVTIDELMGTFATLTGVSGNTAEVSTQLAAIFTALIKPSSEAAEMAAEMGIRFDAAAITAAGGMQNFLTILTTTVSAYAASSGMLETEIYGRLFGSAEALRALIPITGELADTFSSNVTAMAESTGTIEAAFNDMAGSGEAVQQTLRNQITTFTDWAGAVASQIQPYMQFIAIMGQSIMSMKILSDCTSKLAELYRKARTAILAFTTAQKGTAIATALTTVHEKVQTIALNLLTASSWTATAGFTALRAATIALYAALSLGITLIIHGLISLFSSLGDEAEETTEQIDHLAQAQETFRSTAADARASIDMEISKLRELITTQGDETEAVRSLNERYGEIFGKHESAAEWYETLIAKSAAYCAQFGYEAQARQIAARKAELEMKRDEKARQRSQVDQFKVSLWRMDGINPEWEALNQEVNQLEQEIETCATAFNTCVKNMQEASADLAKGISSGAVAATQSIGWQQMSYAELGQEIRRTKERLEELMGVDAEAAAKQQQLLDAQTRRYEALGKQYGLIKADTTPSSGLPAKAASPTTDNSTGNGGLYGSDLKDLLGDAATIAQLEDAIRHYREMQRHASADEIADIQTTINLLEGKRQKLIDLAVPPQPKSDKTLDELIRSQEALEDLRNLTGKPLTIELQAIGLEEIRAKIRSLQGLLDDPMNPLSEKDAQGVQENILAWQGYEQSLIQAQTRGKMVQDAVRNMGSIMSSLSGVVGQGAAGWLQYGANILSAVAEAIPSITQMIAANTAQAYSGAAAQSQSVPFPYNLIALAASMASVTAAVLSIPKFANGAIAYGPTLGIFGEYAGASSNPEVVAPLDRLRDIIGETSSGRDGLSGKVEFSIKNRRLYAALRNEEKYRRRM